jgi:hypothetical protein
VSPSPGQEHAAGAKQPWGPEQATGAPNTQQAGDAPTAWASLLPDAGEEWLQLDYGREVAIAQVRIRETLNAGAVSKITALLANGEEKVLWEGQDPTKEAVDYFEVKPAAEATAKSVKVYLDTARVPGWNEIDAVELVGKDGTRQWAARACASSTHAAELREPGRASGPQDALKKAAVEDKYDVLLRKILVEDDVVTYQEFRDYGYYTGTQWKGHTDLPPGYWVYVYPHWYIWRVRYPAPGQQRAWGPEQATGAPDTRDAGDLQTAWASLHADGGPEWLQLKYERPVAIAQVRIHETYNPGAVCKVTAILSSGQEKLLWEGQDPIRQAPAFFEVKAAAEVVANTIVVHIDSDAVPGWNEIDAVELVGKDGARQWAIRAAASSTYAEQPQQPQEPIEPIPPQPPLDPFAEFLRHRVKVHVEGNQVLEGILLRSHGGFLVLRPQGAERTLVINKQKILYAEVTPPPGGGPL